MDEAAHRLGIGQPRGGVARRRQWRGRGLLSHGIVHQHEPGEQPVAMRVHIGERIQHAQRPGDHDDRHRGQVGDQFGDVLRPPVRLIPTRRGLGLALPARIEGDHVIGPAEGAELLRPDPGRHGPARDEDQRMAGGRAGLEVVQPRTVAGDEESVVDGEAVGRGGRPCAGGQHQGQQRKHEPDSQPAPSHGTQMRNPARVVSITNTPRPTGSHPRPARGRTSPRPARQRRPGSSVVHTCSEGWVRDRPVPAGASCGRRNGFGATPSGRG